MQPKPANPAVTTDLKRLWAGELPLGRVFWTYNVVYGVVLNLTCTALGLVLYMLSGNALLAFLLHLLPLPYMAFVTMGVWRSADRTPNAGLMPVMAKIGSVALIFASLLI